jgi:hypothetical protein
MPELIRYYRPDPKTLGRESLMAKLAWLSPGLILFGIMLGHLIEAAIGGLGR